MPVILKAAPSSAPVTVDIHSDVKIYCKRLDTPMWMQTQALARERASEGADEALRVDDQMTDAAGMGLIEYHQLLALAELSWVGWEGFTDEDGEPVPFDRELIPIAIKSEWVVATVWFRKYIAGLTSDGAEKNGSASGAGGTGATAPTTAASAPTPTAPVPEVSPA